MSLYFRDITTTISTLLVVGILIFIGIIAAKHKNVRLWGRQIAILAVWGLIVCIAVALRDKYHLSVQASMDPKILPGLFTIESIQSTLCCLGGAVIAFCTISSIFIRKQGYMKAMFFILSGTVIFKILVIELSRLLF
jgi:hypothetical protein